MNCSICERPLDGEPIMVDDHPVCSACDANIKAYEQRVSDRVDRLHARAEKASEEFHSAMTTARKMGEAIPFGQPILVGHHSEGRDRRYRARIDGHYRRGYEAMKRAQRLGASAEAVEKNRTISSDDPAAPLKLQSQIARAEELQTAMREANKLVRKLVKQDALTDEERGERLHAALPVISLKNAVALFEPDLCGRVGFPSYALSNNSANIRRLKGRLENTKHLAVERAEAEEAGETVRREASEALPDVEIETDLDDNRIRIYFPAKPSPEARQLLKASGFKWSPMNSAWQRQLTDRAERSVGYVLGQIAQLPAGNRYG